MWIRMAAVVLALAAQRVLAGEAQLSSEDIYKLIPVDLRYKREEMPETENAFVVWREAIEKRVPAKDETLSKAILATTRQSSAFPVGDEGKLLREWIATNATALELMEKGNARGKCQLPPENLLLPAPHLAPLRELARIRVCKAKMLMKDEDHIGAAAQAESMIRTGELMLSGEGSAIPSLVALAILSYGVETARIIAKDRRTSEGALMRLLKATHPDLSLRQIERTYRVEFDSLITQQCSRAATQSKPAEQLAALLEKGQPSQNLLIRCEALVALNPNVFDLRETMKFGSRMGERLVRLTDKPWPERNRDLISDIEKFAKEWDGAYMKFFNYMVAGSVVLPEEIVKNVREATKEFKPGRELLDAMTVKMSDEERKQFEEVLLKKPNAFGEMWLAMLLPVEVHLYAQFCRAQAERVATRTIVGLQIHKRRKGELPENLEALKKEQILDDVPVDPFSGKMMKYSKKDARIWSVFKDEVDDEGVNDKDLAWDIN